MSDPRSLDALVAMCEERGFSWSLRRNDDGSYGADCRSAKDSGDPAAYETENYPTAYEAFLDAVNGLVATEAEYAEFRANYVPDDEGEDE